MQKVVQRRRGAQAWQELVSRQAQSGLSALAFCRREGLSPWSFYQWRTRLRAGADGVAISERAERGTASSFIELGGLKTESSRWEIRLDLGDGVILHLARG